MMERRERRVCSGSLAMSMPSMMMRPAWRQCHGWGTAEGNGGAGAWVQSGTRVPVRMQEETVIAGPPVMSEHMPGRRSHLIAVGICGVPTVPLTFEHVHHAEKGKREGGLPTARAATDPDLEREGQVCWGALGVVGSLCC